MRLNVETLEAAKRYFSKLGKHLFNGSYFGIRCDLCGKTRYVEGRYLLKKIDDKSYKCSDCISKEICEKMKRRLHHTKTKLTIENTEKQILNMPNGEKHDEKASAAVAKQNSYSNFFAINNYNMIRTKIIKSINNSNRMGITDSKVIDKNLIVSLTTTWNRIKETPLAIETILNQQVMPNKIILWLGEEYKDMDLPKDIKKQIRRGLTVKYCKDVGPGTKLIPALKEFPEDVIITVDSDIFYDNTLIKDLVNSYKKDRSAIHAIRCRNVSANNWMPNEYKKWKIIKHEQFESCSCLATGVGGVLYPPNTLHKNVFDIASLKECAFKQDDLWFYTMEMINGTRIINVKSTSKLGPNGYAENMRTANNGGLWKTNTHVGGGNDVSIKKLVEKYLRRTISVCYVCNTHFKPWLELSMRSIIYNNPFIKVNFHILTDEKKFVAPRIKNTKVHFIDTSKIKRKDLITKRISAKIKTSLCKFFIPKVLGDCDRVLYMDCDTACCGPLYELIDMDINDKSIAVVEDYWLTHSKQYENSRSRKIANNYFNSGMILYNIKLCKNTCEKLLDWNEKNEHMFMDQDALNAIFKESKKMLSPKFNMTCRYYTDGANVINSRDMVKLPIILHFTGATKPDAGGRVKKEVYNFYNKMRKR